MESADILFLLNKSSPAGIVFLTTLNYVNVIIYNIKKTKFFEIF